MVDALRSPIDAGVFNPRVDCKFLILVERLGKSIDTDLVSPKALMFVDVLRGSIDGLRKHIDGFDRFIDGFERFIDGSRGSIDAARRHTQV